MLRICGPAICAAALGQRRDSAASSRLSAMSASFDAGTDGDHRRECAGRAIELISRNAPPRPARLTTLSGWATYSFCRSSRSVPPASSSVLPHFSSSSGRRACDGRRADSR